MKKFISAFIVSIAVLVCGFVAGYSTGKENGKNFILSQYELLHNDYDAKTELIDAQRTALDAADHVIGEHNLFDTDGGDTMAKYLDLAHKVDSLYQLGE
ncbi:MAG: hypothetical protein [Bacteriophage sp.]|nr:MAG: hypothetical protein [Bacteriophage sp.]